MTMALRPYVGTKVSGVPWVGVVPTHWDVLPLKRIGKFQAGAGFPISEQGNAGEDVLFVKVADMNLLGNEREIVSASNTVSHEVARRLGARIFERGTIIFPKVGGALLTNKRRLLARETCIDNNLMGCIVAGADTDFAFRILSWLDFGRLAKPGPVPAISEGEIREIRIALPTVPEQTAIARFLDHMDHRIQKYIRAKEKLIALLDEYKQALIHQAVTGQIDVRTGEPYGEYKESGVEWLGRVPGHWGIVGLGRLISLTPGFAFKSEGFTRAQEDIRLLRGVNIAPGRIRWEDVVRWPIGDVEELTEYQLCEGDIVLGMDRPIIRTGIRLARISESDTPALLLQRVARVRPKSELHPGFAVQILAGQGFYNYLSPIFTGISVPHLSPEQISRFRLALPPVNEQSAILDRIKQSATQLDLSISAAEQEMGLMAEYRTRLIADVVTGKLDVREAARRLPDLDSIDDDSATTSLN